MKYVITIILKTLLYIVIMPFIVIKDIWDFKFFDTRHLHEAYTESMKTNLYRIKMNLKSNL